MFFRYIYTVFVALIFTGCGISPEVKQYRNPVLQDESFLNALEELDITLVSPSSGIPYEEINILKGIFDGKVKLLSDRHYIKPQPWGQDESDEDLKEISKALGSGGIIWAVRGGYGATGLVGKILRKHQDICSTKGIIIGYSDITALHLLMAKKGKWFCIHAPMARELFYEKHDSTGFYELIEILSGQKKCVEIDILPINDIAEENAGVSGLLTGGNLALVEASIGTAWQAVCKDKIVFLEDIDCNQGQVMRSLIHLEESGVLIGAKAIVFGCFSKEGNQEMMPVLKDFAKIFGRPVFVTDKFGHGYYNRPIGYNVNGCIKRNDKDSGFTLNIDFSTIPIIKKDFVCRKARL